MASKNHPKSQSQVQQNVTDNKIQIDLSYMGSREEVADGRTVASRQRLRDQVSSEVEAFLAKGGKINTVEPNVTADPPKRPESNYGQRPI